MRHSRPAARLLAAAAGVFLATQLTAADEPRTVTAYAPVVTPAAVTATGVITQDSRTYVYLVNGADPFGWAGLARLAFRFQVAGYPNTRYGEVYDIGTFEREIREVHARDPAARFVLVGFSFGTLVVRSAANRLVDDGVPVAMVGYIGGDYLKDTAYSHPAQVGRVVNVTGNGYMVSGRNLFWNGTDLTGAANSRLTGVAHFGLPGHPQTYRMLLAGLYEVTAGP